MYVIQHIVEMLSMERQVFIQTIFPLFDELITPENYLGIYRFHQNLHIFVSHIIKTKLYVLVCDKDISFGFSDVAIFLQTIFYNDHQKQSIKNTTFSVASLKQRVEEPVKESNKKFCFKKIKTKIKLFCHNLSAIIIGYKSIPYSKIRSIQWINNTRIKKYGYYNLSNFNIPMQIKNIIIEMAYF